MAGMEETEDMTGVVDQTEMVVVMIEMADGIRKEGRELSQRQLDISC